MALYTPPKKSGSFRDIDYYHYFRHYVDLIWRWKVWIFASSAATILAIVLYFFKFSSLTPELTAAAYIGLENQSASSSDAPILDVTSEVGRSKAELIRSRNFLKEVVEKLSLCLVMPEMNRKEVFDSISLQSSATLGTYEFDVQNYNSYQITFSNSLFKRNKSIIRKGTLVFLDTLQLPGVYLKFNRAFKINPRTFKFSIAHKQKAVESLYKKITVNPPDPYKGRFSIEVALAGKDYLLITETVNAIVDMFIEKSLMSRRRLTENILAQLEKQYVQAKNELDLAESQLQQFRTANPKVGLDINAQQTISSLTDLELTSRQTVDFLKAAKELQAKFVSSHLEDRPQVAAEIFVLLKNRNNVSAPVLEAELQRLQTEKRELQKSYVDGHPLMVENVKALEKLMTKVYIELNAALKNDENNVVQKTTNLENLQKELQRLPVKELQLAQLQRQFQISSDIYSNVLDRYKKAKVADVVDVSDVYVLDHAVPPIPPPMNYLQLLAICLGIILAVAMGPMILFDFVDKTVRTEYELQSMTELPVLQTIPRIQTTRGKK
ncbi:MAG: hypothetical protein JW795_12140 [Chitinivibrionales bacterium]|nr:hypothetical protein [Chitinivibrionales bacterium]